MQHIYKRMLMRFFCVVCSMLIVCMAMLKPEQAMATETLWGYGENGVAQSFDTVYRVTGLIMKKTRNGAATLYWENGSLPLIRIQIYKNNTASTTSGNPLRATTEGGATVPYVELRTKNYRYGIEINATVGQYCFLTVAGTRTGTAFGSWDPL